MKISVHVKPGSRRESIEWVENLFGERTLVVKIREKPVDGEANRGLIEALSDFLDIPKSRVQIIRGHTSREKVVEIIEVK